MLTLKNVTLTTEPGTPLQRTIMNNLSLDVARGEFITIIGGNGAGKSTLFNLISGSLLPTAGSIRIDQTDVTKKSISERAALIGLVRQDPHAATVVDMTIEENLSFAFLRGKKRHLLPHKRVDRLALFRQKLAMLELDLENRLENLTGLLSGGQRQALSLVMATLAPAKILLLDEHTAALDPSMARRIMNITQQLARQTGLTTLMITHNMTDALNYGDRTIVLKGGQIIKELSSHDKSFLKPSDLAELLEAA